MTEQADRVTIMESTWSPASLESANQRPGDSYDMALSQWAPPLQVKKVSE